ncbi:MAG: hypothetical protein F9K24_11160 [Leptonema illini]|uniref:Uncharacterized protein n=1 Tax=Leptonema illini TaxID=183 RepID=A0A833H1P4_9LEPT|nr:MAG: hypothetical protein F9K24_11160 [Leptonema illini]
MKRTLLLLPMLFFAVSTLMADPKPKERTPAQQAVYGVCVKRCTDEHKSCEDGASALKKAACANNLRVCKNDCEKKH